MYQPKELQQRVGLFEWNIFKLEKDDIEVCYKGIFKTHTARIPLDVFNKNPVQYRKLNIKALIMFLLCLTVIVVSALAFYQDPIKNKGVFIVGGSFFGIGCLAALNAFFKSSIDAFIFTNKNNGANLLALFPKKSSSSEFESFVGELKKRIDSIHYPESISHHQRNEIYNKHLEFLFHEGVLTEVEFTNVTQRIKKSNNADVIKLV